MKTAMRRTTGSRRDPRGTAERAPRGMLLSAGIPAVVILLASMLVGSPLVGANTTPTGPAAEDEPGAFLPSPNPIAYCDSPDYFGTWTKNQAMYDNSGNVDVEPLLDEDGDGDPTNDTGRQDIVTDVAATGGGITATYTATSNNPHIHPNTVNGLSHGASGPDGGTVALSEPLFYSQWVFVDIDLDSEGFEVTPGWAGPPGQLAAFGGDPDFAFTAADAGFEASGPGSSNLVLDFNDTNAVNQSAADLETRVQAEFLGPITSFDVFKSGAGNAGFSGGGGCAGIGLAKEVSEPIWDASTGTFVVDYTLRVKNNLPSTATLTALLDAAESAAPSSFIGGDPTGIDEANVQVTDMLDLTGFSTGVVSDLASPGFAINPAYDGQTDTDLLLGTDTLAAEDIEEITFTVAYTPDFTDPVWTECAHSVENSAEVTASANTVLVSDASDDGPDPSPAATNRAGTGTDDPSSMSFSLDCEIGLAKTVTAGPTSRGDGSYELEYTFVVENSGQAPLSNPVISDDLGATFGAAFTSSSVQSTTCTGAVLAPSETCSHVLDVVVTPSSSLGPWNNSAVVSAEGPGDTPLTDTSHDGADPDPEDDGPGDNSAPTPLTMRPQIGLAKALTKAPTTDGEGTYDMTYTLVAENTGEVYLTNLSVVDDLTATFGTAYLGSTTPTDTCAGAALDVGETCTVVIDVTITPGSELGPWNNEATVTADGPGDVTVTDDSTNGDDVDPDEDGDPTNNAEPTPVSLVETPQIGLAKALTGGPSSNGDGTYDVSYTLIARNTGDVRLSNVVVSDDLVATFGTALSSTTTSDGCQGVTLNASSPAGDGETCAVVIDVVIAPGTELGPWQNEAAVTASSAGGATVVDDSTNGEDVDPDKDGDPTNNSEPTPVSLVETPEIGLTKTVSNVQAASDGTFTLDYVIGVFNTGDVPLNNVTVVDELDGVFGPGGYSVTGVDASSGTVALTVNAGYTGVPGLAGVVDTDDLLDGTDTLAAQSSALIVLSISFTPDGNHGPFENTAVGQGESPAGFIVVDHSNDSPAVASTGGPDTGTYGYLDPDPDDNGDPTDNSLPSTVLLPALGTTKSLASMQNNGDGSYDVSYDIAVTNVGPVDLVDVQLTDDLATTFMAASSWAVESISSSTLTVNPSFDGGDDPNLLAGSDPLAHGASGTVTVAVTVWPGADLGPYDNSATGSANTPPQILANGTTIPGTSTSDDSLSTAPTDSNPDPDGDGDPTNNDRPTTLDLTERPQIGVTKALLAGPAQKADGFFTMTFAVGVFNSGDVILADVAAEDDLAATFGTGATISVISVEASAPGSVNPSYDGVTDIQLLTDTTLVPGASTTVTIVVEVKTAGSFENSAIATGVSPAGRPVDDVSHDQGTDLDSAPGPDPDGDGDPTNNDAPTTVVLTAEAANDVDLDNEPGASVAIDPLANDRGLIDPRSVELFDPTKQQWTTTLAVAGEGTWSVNPETGETTFAPESGFLSDPTPVTYRTQVLGTQLWIEATMTVSYRYPLLAFTGAELRALFTFGLVLLLVGAMFTMLGRTRRRLARTL